MGTMTVTTPVEVIEETVEDQGDCFTVKANDNPCFSVTSSQDQCFFINRDEDDTNFFTPPELNLEPLGFTSIVCVQAHGSQNLVVIGTYNDNDVIANVLYIGGSINGVSKIYDVGTVKSLVDYGIGLLDIDRLDGYDLDSITSNLCIVLQDDTTIWIEPIFFLEHNRQINSGSDPYFNEDDYYTGALLVDERYPVNIGDYNDEYYNIDDCSLKSSTPTSGIYNATVREIITKSQADATDVATGIYNSRLIYHDPEYCSTEPFLYCGFVNYGEGSSMRSEFDHRIQRKRKDFMLDTSAQVIPNLDVEFVSASRKCWTYIDEGGNDIHKAMEPFLFVGWYSDVLRSPAIQLQNSGVKLCTDGDFYANVLIDTMMYSNTDGTITGVMTGKNFTLVNACVLMADGSSTITQTVLN